LTGSTTPGVTSQLADGTAAGSWVLDPTGSKAEFHVKHFWGAMTVHGSMGPMTGEATIAPDGGVTGRIAFDVRGLDTGHSKRDEHLRSDDFFTAGTCPEAVLTVSAARPSGPDRLDCEGTFEAAGHVRPVAFTARIEEAAAQAVVLTAELQVDRSEFGMTWSPLRMSAMTARGTVKARFTRG
jgi:polyisoprenoid-binding protein YceI